jgi:hypothetical protein
MSCEQDDLTMYSLRLTRKALTSTTSVESLFSWVPCWKKQIVRVKKVGLCRYFCHLLLVHNLLDVHRVIRLKKIYAQFFHKWNARENNDIKLAGTRNNFTSATLCIFSWNTSIAGYECVKVWASLHAIIVKVKSWSREPARACTLFHAVTKSCVGGHDSGEYCDNNFVGCDDVQCGRRVALRVCRLRHVISVRSCYESKHTFTLACDLYQHDLWCVNSVLADVRLIAGRLIPAVQKSNYQHQHVIDTFVITVDADNCNKRGNVRIS